MFPSAKKSGKIDGIFPSTLVRRHMRAALLFACTLLSNIICAENQRESDRTAPANSIARVPRELAGLWAVRIENLQHQVVTTMKIEFAVDPAESCMCGDWRRVVVKSHQTSNKQFFPFNEPLSYKLEKGGIVIGRNEVCDAYLHLKGSFRDSVAQGEYVGFGLGGGERLGYFSLRRSQ